MITHDEYAATLDALGMDVLADRIGWSCRWCGERMIVPETPRDEAVLRVLFVMLSDAARKHAEAGCDR